MTHGVKRLALLVLLLLFLFALIRLGTSTYENLIRTTHP